MTKRPRPPQVIPAEATKVFTGVIFDVYQWQQPLYDGTSTTFEALRRPDSVNILPITPEAKIIVTRQTQPGMKQFTGAIAGRLDPGESPLEGAKRELLEESGITAREFELWDVTQIAEKLDWACFTFIAKGITRGPSHVDGGEKIQLIELTFEEYFEAVSQDEYRDREISLKLLKLSRRPGALEAVKAEWLA